MDTSRISTKVAHAIAGLSTGLICYAAYLYGFIFLGPRSSSYWLMPMPGQSGSAAEYYKAVFYLMWQFNRLEIITVVVGLVFPLAFVGYAWFRAGRRPVSWLNRWPVQLTFAVIGVMAILVILNNITFILPMPPL